MKNPKRFISCIFFCAILLLPILAIGILQLSQAYIKSEREERLQTERLEKVIVPVKHIVWEEEGKELWVNNRMFDVASFVIKDNNYYLTGVYDDEETEIAGSLLHLIFSKTGKDLLCLLFLLQFFTGCIFGMASFFKLWSHQKQLIFYLDVLPSPFQLILAPPPRP